MALSFDTFVNPTFTGAGAGPAGGLTLFKALGHPLAAERAPALLARLAAAKRLAVYDPLGQADTADQFYGLSALPVAELYVQRLEDLSRRPLGRAPKPVSELAASQADLLLIAAFDADRLRRQIDWLLPQGIEVVALDALRLPDGLLSNPRDYLAPVNFATNFALFRDEPGQHTAVVTANYWSLYGAASPRLWCRLFDRAGGALATWTEALPTAGGGVRIDSQAVRRRFGLGDFCGSLYLHAVGVAGHEIVKYALDVYGDDGATLSCTHDANAWPADFYAGLPAPAPGERVTLWVQNSHPVPIPAGRVALNPMGRDGEARAWDVEVPPFGTTALDLGALFPEARWPQQFEIRAGKHFVRPRYEILKGNGRSRIAHANVERTDLEPNPELPALTRHMGKGFVMPLPVLPLDRFRSLALPTPMARGQAELPLAAILLDGSGEEVARRFLGRVRRDDCAPVEVDAWLAAERLSLPSGFGHLELVYDFRDGGGGDGWLHAIGRYEARASGHAAETSFGSHVFNVAEVYRDEPQSYAGRPPGLSTRLFLRLGPAGTDAFCHLIYPASKPWRPKSSTELKLIGADGGTLAEARLEIPCGGSRFWQASEFFSAAQIAAAGPAAYVLVRDETCRLFGYHGLLTAEAFSLDHMFGF